MAISGKHLLSTLLLLAAIGPIGAAQPPEIVPTPAPQPSAPVPGPVVAASGAVPEGMSSVAPSGGCPTCGAAAPPLPGPYAPAVDSSERRCGCESCVPGRGPCYPCEAQGPVGRFLCLIYENVCCQDPCYEPRWLPIADAAFGCDAVRPVTQQRVRWNTGMNLVMPDRSEFFWARADGKGRGPKPPSGVLGETALRYNELSMYTEAATPTAGMFVEIPYRAVYPDQYPFAAGFSDMNTGIKSLFFDSELVQVAIQFRTYVPMGGARRGLGTGHVSLEPSTILSVKLTPDAYLQGQIAEWIPLGGDTNYQGSVLHYHCSLNQTLYRPLPTVPIIGTLELNGWSFQHGKYTDSVTGQPVQSSGTTYLSLGTGARIYVCDRFDFGLAVAFAPTSPHWASQLYTAELRWRY